jgi:hypothetical protein
LNMENDDHRIHICLGSLRYEMTQSEL